MTERSEDQYGRRTGSANCWPELLVSQEQSPALGEVAEWLCTPEGGTQATLTGNQQLLKKAYVDGNYQSTVTYCDQPNQSMKTEEYQEAKQPLIWLCCSYCCAAFWYPHA